MIIAIIIMIISIRNEIVFGCLFILPLKMYYILNQKKKYILPQKKTHTHKL